MCGHCKPHAATPVQNSKESQTATCRQNYHAHPPPSPHSRHAHSTWVTQPLLGAGGRASCMCCSRPRPAAPQLLLMPVPCHSTPPPPSKAAATQPSEHGCVHPSILAATTTTV
mmetsp:Transcript_13471/g.32989  ORF Transcript_13471/g.32989 Transcript_13471/m.32989 type:complete len:113 (-) Transcript_13471:2003-2341(-)